MIGILGFRAHFHIEISKKYGLVLCGLLRRWQMRGEPIGCEDVQAWASLEEWLDVSERGSISLRLNGRVDRGVGTNTDESWEIWEYHFA